MDSSLYNSFKNAFHVSRGKLTTTTIHGQKYLISLLAFLLIFASSPVQINAFWLPPDYWVTIHRDGQIEPGRSQRDFIQFPPINGAEYIGYWINSTRTHQESYGHVSVSQNLRRSPDGSSSRFCGHFLDSQSGQSLFLCGGFRVLAYKINTRQPCPNPFTFVAASVAIPLFAVEYLDNQIARVQLDDGQWVFGAAKIGERLAFAIDPRRGGVPVKLSFTDDQRAYRNRVEILQRSTAFPVEDLVDDSSPPRHPQPLPPIPEPPSLPTTTEIEPTTTTMTTEPEEMLQQTTTSSPPPGLEDHNDEGLSGAGVEWGALFTGDGVEEVEQKMKKRRRNAQQWSSMKTSMGTRNHRRRRHHHFKHKNTIHSIRNGTTILTE